GVPYSLPTGTVTNSSGLSFFPMVVGNYVVTLAVTDKDGGVGTTTAELHVTNVSATSLQNRLNFQLEEGPGLSVVTLTLQTDPTQINAMTDALNGIVRAFDSIQDVVPDIVTLYLTSGTYPDTVFNLQYGVTVAVNGVLADTGSTTIKGGSP